jgi:hypothetical protein
MMQNHSHHFRCRANHHSSLSSSPRWRKENCSANSFFFSVLLKLLQAAGRGELWLMGTDSNKVSGSG